MGICSEERNKKESINVGAPLPVIGTNYPEDEVLPDFDDLNIEINNIIKMKIEIKKNDVNKPTKILYNIDKIIPGCDLKELNESNTLLFINGKQYKYKSYFIPNEKGMYEIKLILKILMKNCCCMFYGLSNLRTIDLSSFNTQNVCNMSYMFYNCNQLPSINLSSFNTQNVYDMSYMFYNCNQIENLNLSSFNTQNVYNMSYMFYNCYKLQNLDLSSFNTHNVTNMSYMFYDCNKLQNLDLSSFNTPKLNYMVSMFYNCSNLKTLDLSSFNTKSKAKGKTKKYAFLTLTEGPQDYMFTDCIKLERVVLSYDAADLYEVCKNNLSESFKNNMIIYV